MWLLQRSILYQRTDTGAAIPREVSASHVCRSRKFRS